MVKDLNKITKIVLMACAVVLVIAVSGSLIYYFGFFRPRNEQAKWEEQLAVEEAEGKAKLELEKEKLELEKEKQKYEVLKELTEERKEAEEKYQEEQEKLQKELALYECLDGAYEAYAKQWNEQCEKLGRPDECILPIATADWINEHHKNAKEQCFKLYGSD